MEILSYIGARTAVETTGAQDTSNISEISNDEHKVGYETEKNLPTPDQSSEDDKLSGVKLLVLGFALCFMVFLINLNGTVVATAVPQITNRFNSLNDVGWYGSASLLTNCATSPLTGKIYTFSPLKGTFIGFLSIYMLSNLPSAVAVSSNMLIIGRAVQGIGGAGVWNGVFTIIAAAVPRDKKLSAVIGPVIGGPLTQHASWRWCFYINLPPVGLTILHLLFLRIPEQTAKKPISQNIITLVRELDIGGFVLFASTCIMFLLALNWGSSTYPWKSATVIGLICGSLVTACIFAVWQRRRGDRAMIPPTIISNRLVLFGCLVSGFQMGALALLAYYLPLWLQIVKDASPTNSGVMTLPSAISQALGSRSTPRKCTCVAETRRRLPATRSSC
ncbi:Efflux pump mlcE [Talaromyces pinophilus]|nr:Efflux pump mlcE [Talaromyces pinophilus]